MNFDVKDYWERRYQEGKNSGSGSYGRLAKFKAKVVNEFVLTNNIYDVLEIGCGDGNQLDLLKVPNYTGTDISDHIIEQNKKKFSDDPKKQFLTFSEFINQKKQYPLVLSLDVIYHLSEDEIFSEYMTLLFTRSTKYVLIYSNNNEIYPLAVKSDAGYLFFRKFDEFITRNFSDWVLIDKIINPYQYSSVLPGDTSFADFYIFEKDSIKQRFVIDKNFSHIESLLISNHLTTNDSLFAMSKGTNSELEQVKKSIYEMLTTNDSLLSISKGTNSELEQVRKSIYEILTINDSLLSISKGTNSDLEQVKKSIYEIFKNQAEINNKISNLEKKISKTKEWEKKYFEITSSKRYVFATAIAVALHNPINFAKRLKRFLVKKKIRNIKSNITIENLVTSKNEKLSIENLRVAVIVDEFTAEAFKQMKNVLFLSPDNWEKEIDTYKPHLLFVESCWRGNGDTWGRLTVQTGGIGKLEPVTNYCKEKNIKTVFWNKEDPLHYYAHNQNKFGGIAALFEHVYTSDSNMLDAYKNDFGISVKPLNFFCIPTIHFDNGSKKRKNAAVFAGSYYRDKDERCNDFKMIIDAVTETGLEYEIYDRNLDKGIDNLLYPEPYSLHVIGTLSPEDVRIAHLNYKYQINVNTIKHSPTMFSRRIYESLASGTPIITNYSKGVDLLFGDIVIMGKTKHEIIQKIKFYEENPEEYEKIKIKGIQRCHELHTFYNRIEEICVNIGIPLKIKKKSSVNILVYADVDLNYIDGSSIWLCSFVEMLSKQPNYNIQVLLKSNSNKSELVQSLYDLQNVRLIFPKSLGYSNRLNNDDYVSAIRKIDHCSPDYVIVRGYKSCLAMLENHEYQGRLISYILEEISSNHINSIDVENMKKIYNFSAFLIVQSQNMLKKYIDLFGFDVNKLILLPPYVPNQHEVREFINNNNSIVYTGKFSKTWYTNELLQLFDLLKQTLPSVKLNIAGSLFRTDLINREEIKQRFSDDHAINFVQGVSRSDSLELIHQSDIGFALRDELIDNNESNEISTKVLEYMSFGKPVILRNTKIHKELLGEDYFLFADSVVEAAEKCIQLFTNPDLYNRNAKRCYERFEQFARMNIHEKEIRKLKVEAIYRPTILFASHDFKFIKLIISAIENEGNYRVLIDHWDGHNKHDESKSRKLLDQADIIFCEWGLGNTVWYSRNKKASQKMIVRMHLQERETEYPNQFVIENIDRIVYVSPYIRDVFQELFHFPEEKIRMIYNYVDADYFDKEKISGNEYNIGFVGMIPQRKRLDRAIDIIERLYSLDNRYKLYVKGKRPEEYNWMRNRIDEMKYYDTLFERIEKSNLKNIVFFDKAGNDMDEWFRKIGYILSVSDFESFHLAPSEGMASGATPVILHWEGAETIHPKEYIVENIEQAVDFILNSQAYNERNKEIIYQQFDLPKIYREYKNLLSEL